MSAERFATVGDLAAATIDVLDERGWCQVFLEVDGRVCLIGGANTAAYGSPIPLVGEDDSNGPSFTTPAARALASALIATNPDISDCLRVLRARYGDKATDEIDGTWRWNDDEARTVEDVKLALKHAAESTEPCPDLTIEASR